MKCHIDIKNAPSYVENQNEFVVCRIVNGEFVYHGAYKEEDRAKIVAMSIKGFYVKRKYDHPEYFKKGSGGMTYDDNCCPDWDSIAEEVEHSPQRRCNLVCRDISTATRMINRYRKKYYDCPSLMDRYYIERRGNMITVGKY